MSGSTYAAAISIPEDDDAATAAGAAPVPRYEFDLDFQEKIAALTLRDTKFAQLTDGLIRPEYFENAAHAALVATASRYYDKYKKAPGDKTTLASLMNCLLYTSDAADE